MKKMEPCECTRGFLGSGTKSLRPKSEKIFLSQGEILEGQRFVGSTTHYSTPQREIRMTLL